MVPVGMVMCAVSVNGIWVMIYTMSHAAYLFGPVIGRALVVGVDGDPPVELLQIAAFERSEDRQSGSSSPSRKDLHLSLGISQRRCL